MCIQFLQGATSEGVDGEPWRLIEKGFPLRTPLTAPKPYLTWTTDSTRWGYYTPRTGDVITGTAWQCGTTWTQQIVSLLIFQSPEPRPSVEISPWIDCRFLLPLEEMQELIEAQSHRRFLKSHLPFDGLPSYEQVRYLHVARDGGDQCMSSFHPCSGLTPAAYEKFDRAAAAPHGPFPRCPDDPRIFWRDWLTRGVQAGETDGYPDLSFFNVEATYGRARHRENVLLVHFNELKAD